MSSFSRLFGAKDERTVRFAVIGQGYFAQSAILPAFANAPNCELAAIFSEDEDKRRELGRKYEVKTALPYDQLDNYLNTGEVDAVYIALPNHLHCAYALRAAQAGVHVLCEKPMATSSDEAEAMIAACDASGVVLMIGYRLHFEAANLAAIDCIQSGELGDPRFFSSTFAMQIRKDNVRTDGRRGGGPLGDIGIYCVNAARGLFRAEPLEVTAISATRKNDDRFEDIDEQVSALLRFPGDRLAQFTCGFGAYDHSALTVVCGHGRLRMDPAYDMATDLVVETQLNGQRPKRQVFKKRDQIAAELIEFADCILEGREPEPSGVEGLADLRVLEAIEEAATTGRRVQVQSVERQRRPSLLQERRAPAHAMPPLINVQPPGQR